jgi:hypothetical protein
LLNLFSSLKALTDHTGRQGHPVKRFHQRKLFWNAPPWPFLLRRRTSRDVGDIPLSSCYLGLLLLSSCSCGRGGSRTTHAHLTKPLKLAFFARSPCSFGELGACFIRQRALLLRFPFAARARAAFAMWNMVLVALFGPTSCKRFTQGALFQSLIAPAFRGGVNGLGSVASPDHSVLVYTNF